MSCWRCKATYDNRVPYWDLSMGAKWRATRHNSGTIFKAQRLARATASPMFTCLGFTLDMVCVGTMHCVDLWIIQEVWATSSVSTWTRGACQVVPRRQGVKVCGGQTELVHNNISPQVRFKLWVSIRAIRVMVQRILSMPKQQRQGTWRRFGVEHSEELNDLMDFYKCLGDWQRGAHTLGGLCQTVCE